MGKKIISFFLSLTMVICIISIPAPAEESNSVNNAKKIIGNSINNNTSSLVGSPRLSDKDLYKSKTMDNNLIYKNKQAALKANDYKKQAAKIFENLSAGNIAGLTEASLSFNGDPYEPNNDLETAYPINYGTTYESYIGSSDDMDFYKFSITNTGSVNITLSNLPYRYEMWLFNSNGECVTQSVYDESTAQARMDYDFNESGTYYIKVDGCLYDYYYYYSKTQKYSLKAALQPKLNDPYEPNDTIETAYLINLGTTYESYIGKIYDEDYYKLNIINDGIVNITLSNIQEGYGFNLCDLNGDYISYSTYDASTGQCVLDYDFNEPGTYYIKIFAYDSYGDYSYNRTQKYSLKAALQTSLDDPYESNDTFDTAYLVNLGTTYESYLGTTFDEDYYKLYVNSVESVKIMLSNLPCIYNISLYNSDCECISSSQYDERTNQSVIDFDFSEPGTYYIGVGGGYGYSRTQKYSLIVTLQPKLEDPYEPNDTMETAYQVNIGGTYESYIGGILDWDYYKLNVSNPGSINITLSNLPCEYDINLYDSNNEYITHSVYDESIAQSKLDFDFTEPGTYYVVVQPYDGYSKSQKYSLKISSQAKLNDPYEINDTIETAYPVNLGTTYQSYIGTSNDVDYYKFNVNNAGSINITLSNLPCEYWMSLFDSDGTEIIYSLYDESTAQSRMDFNVDGPGTYYISVCNFNDYSRSQKYSLTVNKSVSGVSLDKATANLIVGEAVNLTAAVSPSDASNKNVTWSSSNTAAAAVDSTGKVTAVSIGTAAITVRTADGGYTAVCTVTVSSNENPVISGAIDKTIKAGDSFDAKAGVTAADAKDGDLTSKIAVTGSVNTSVPGKYTVTYTVTDSDGNKVSKSITVTVVSRNVQVISLIGSDRYDTAVKLSKSQFVASDTILIVNGAAMADGLGATPLAAFKNAPLLLTETKSLPNVTINEINRLKAKKAIIVGGTGVVSVNVKSQLEALGLGVERVWGSNRYGTSLEVAKYIDKNCYDVSKIVVASGYGEADALSIASAAGRDNMPIILAEKDNIPADVYDWLKSESIGNAYIIGGTGVISDNVLNKIDGITTADVRKNRLGGQNRFETNSLVIDKFYGSVINKTFIAKGYLLIDALAAGPVAAINGAPVVLADKDLTAVQKTVLNKRYGNIIIRAGGGISDTAVNSLKNCLQ